MVVDDTRRWVAVLVSADTLVTALLSIAVAGCGDGRSGDPFVRVDSAGVTLVANSEPDWEVGEAWRVSEEPRVNIGTDAPMSV